MTYENFTEQLLAYRKFQRDTYELYEMGFDFIEGKFKLTDLVNTMLQSSIESHYGQEGFDWVEWFIYESNWGEKDWSTSDTYKVNEDGTSEIVHKKDEVRFGAYDEEDNPICYSLESLWEYLQTFKTKEK